MRTIELRQQVLHFHALEERDQFHCATSS